MDRALLNYLQQSQGQNQGQAQEQSPYNPFDAGIRKAIEGARQSLSMNREQEDRALRNSMLAFANNISQQPRERGFGNNLASAGRAMIPAMSAYDQSEQAALQENNELANQILQYQAAEAKRRADEEERQFWRGHAQEQLAEQKRSTNLLDNFKRNKEARDALKASTKGNNEEGGNIDQFFDYVDKRIKQLGTTAERGRIATVLDKFTPGGIRLNKEQSQLETLEKVLKGALFNAWGYRAQTEFKELPAISPLNDVETNRAVIKELKNITDLKLGKATPDELIARDRAQQQLQDYEQPLLLDQVADTVLMRDPMGAEYRIPANEVEEALRDGLTPAE
jgi:hypothetical protein